MDSIYSLLQVQNKKITTYLTCTEILITETDKIRYQ